MMFNISFIEKKSKCSFGKGMNLTKSHGVVFLVFIQNAIFEYVAII